ncbi:prolipoprotein diacylglyceryl transferase, partial [Candidatus Pelagibacter sp.]|nr:prolipoprotein diacylglyceryl transferase [Candidatus Pelagibacter sp.]
NNTLDIFKIWEGGMSFHGGLIGVLVASIIFAKKNKQDSFLYMDLVSLVAPIGIFFGRLANFINSELYGVPTGVPWAVTFVQIDNLSRHPSQLYEAILEGLILFLILLYFKNKNYLEKPGLISSFFLIFYSIFRFIVEFFRVPDEQLGYLIFNLSMGQIISLILILFGIILFYLKNENKKII